MSKGWIVKGAVQLPEVRDIVREEIETDELYADFLAPTVNVKTPAAKIKMITAGQGKRVVDTSRAEDGSYKQIKFSMTKDFYDTDVYGIEVPIDNMQAIADGSIGLDDQVESATIAVDTLLTSREARVSDEIFNTTLFTGSAYTSDETATKWTDAATDLDARLTVGQKELQKRFGYKKKHLDLVINYDLVDVMAKNIAKEEGIKETKQVLTLPTSEKAEVIRSRYGLRSVMAVASVANSLGFDAGEGRAASFTDIYPEDMALLCRLGKKGGNMSTAGVAWQPVMSKLTTDYEVEQYDTPAKDGTVIRAKEWRGVKVNTKFGFLYTNIK